MARLSPLITQQVTLADLCDLITDGKHGDCTPDDTSGYYFLSCKDVRDGKLIYEGARQISAADFVETHRRTQLEPGDILITNSGTIGRMAIAPDVALTRRTTFQKSVAIVKANIKKVDRKWLYFYLLAEMDRLSAVAGGTAQKNLLLRDMRSFQIDLPDRHTQFRIASVLSAFDDLIENNLRRIAVLEEMTRRIYEEWFFRFRHPGLSGAREVHSKNGLLPSDWRSGTFANIAEKRAVRYEDDLHADLPLVDLSRIPRRSNALVDVGKSSDITTSRTVFRESSVLFGAIRPNFHKVLFAPFDGVSNVSVHNFEPKAPFGTAFLFCTAFSDSTVAWAVQHAGGMKMPTIGWDVLSKMPVVLPSVEVSGRFEEAVLPMLRLASSLVRKNMTLRATRDLLLPRLISGELDVSAMLEPEAFAA